MVGRPTMWTTAADCYGERIRGTAQLASLGEEMNELQAALTTELLRDEMAVAVTIELTSMALSYARLGEHAVRLTQRVPARNPLEPLSSATR